MRLCAEKKLPEPVTKDVTEIVPNKGPLGKAFKKEAKAVTERLAALGLDEIAKIESELESGMASLSLGDSTVSLSKDMIAVKRYQKTVHVEEIIPSVIEPSFGVGRIMYALFEHNFKVGLFLLFTCRVTRILVLRLEKETRQGPISPFHRSLPLSSKFYFLIITPTIAL